jgi:fused signal recognition particle receptor
MKIGLVSSVNSSFGCRGGRPGPAMQSPQNPYDRMASFFSETMHTMGSSQARMLDIVLSQSAASPNASTRVPKALSLLADGPRAIADRAPMLALPAPTLRSPSPVIESQDTPEHIESGAVSDVRNMLDLLSDRKKAASMAKSAMALPSSESVVAAAANSATAVAAKMAAPPEAVVLAANKAAGPPKAVVPTAKKAAGPPKLVAAAPAAVPPKVAFVPPVAAAPAVAPKTAAGPPKPAVAAKAVALVLGCSKCRWSSGGCAQCKRPNYKGKRGHL